MRGWIARQVRRERVKPLAGRRLHLILCAGPRDTRRTVALANEPVYRRHGLAEFSVEDAGVPPDKSQEARGLGHTRHDKPTTLAFGK